VNALARSVPSPDEDLLVVRDLEVTFATGGSQVSAVRGVSLSVKRGEVLGIVGESGSGKSVSMLAVMGLLPPNARRRGSMVFDGRDLLSLNKSGLQSLRGGKLAMIFQDPMTSFNPVLTIGRQVAEAVLAHQPGLSRRQARSRALDLLDLVAIPQAAKRLGNYPHEFSGGMRQRAMIAMAMANDPVLLIADEPTTALDVTVQAQVLEVLDGVRREAGLAMVLISHDLGVVAGMASRVAVMYAGRVVEQGPVDDVFYRSSHPYTRALLSCLPRLDRRGRHGDLAGIGGLPPSMTDLPPGCAFAPRCARATPLCVEDPQLRSVNLTVAACHHPWEPNGGVHR
jgi:oligopeptide/dipeptide ABC transporter ATP-binding protein